MNRTNTQNMEKRPAHPNLPEGLTSAVRAYPAFHIDTEGIDLSNPDKHLMDKANTAICNVLGVVHPAGITGQCLLKTHIGEPRCVTRMKPDYMKGAVRFLSDMGASGIVAGDTTVAYTGDRGHKSNPPGDSGTYLNLAAKHGWSTNGPAGVPFVVLDRPETSVEGEFVFADDENFTQIDGINRFNDFYPAGGFAAADFTINNAHLTLHGLAGVAGCVKSIAMGCSSLKGKLRMHQSLVPRFDEDLCDECGTCVDSCPEGGLSLTGECASPVVDRELCIGCGECLAVCPNGAVTLMGEEITDWKRGEETLPIRMADYIMGIMNGKWDNVIHVLHLYSVTELCDCVDERQEPMIGRDLGFLVGKNPFAIDLIASRMLTDELNKAGRSINESLLKTAERTAVYVNETYGIQIETPLERITLK